jgi:hypothetical protein
MDYNNYLVLYSGGADSTYFVEQEKSAKHLIHFKGRNTSQFQVAMTNANILNRYISIIEDSGQHTRDGETNRIHSLYDTEMVLQASIISISYGLKGIVMCFNADDIGIDVDAVVKIIRGAEPNFEILLPLAKKKASEIRAEMAKSTLKFVSCLNESNCGYCPKCLKNY